MNEKLVIEGVRNFIETNEASITQDIVFQGSQKALHQIVGSNLTPPTGYPYILVICTAVREQSKPQVSNMQQPSREAIYSIRIEFTDQALYTQGEEYPYQQMHDDFRVMVDRLINLIRVQNWVTTTPKLRLQRNDSENDRLVTKNNLSGTWQDTEGSWWATLHSQISFNLEGCVDDTQLYT